MCKSLAEGGQRCAAHTRELLQTAANRLQQAAEAGDRNTYFAAREKWEAAAVDYASTPAGKAVLEKQMAQVAEAGDVHTEGMLASIIRRGDAVRAACAEIKATMALTSLTANLPEAEDEIDYEIAEDLNGNPLIGDDAEAWTKALQAVARERATATGYDAEQATQKWQQFVDLDHTIASPDSTDLDIANRFNRVVGYGEYGQRLLTQEMDTGVSAQLRRALDHPNAGRSTFWKAAERFPANEVLAHPRVPASTLDRATEMLSQRVSIAGNAPQPQQRLEYARAADITDATWGALSERSRSGDVSAAVLVATHHPDAYARDDAILTISSADFSTLGTQRTRRLLNALAEVQAPEQTKRMIADSAETYATRILEDPLERRDLLSTVEHLRRQLDQRAAADNDKERPKVSLLRWDR